MKPPVYDRDICSVCGVVALDAEKHTAWHAALARLLGLEVDE